MNNLRFEQMSKEELILELEKLGDTQRLPARRSAESDAARVLHDLQVHQVELEMQNRELRETQGLLEESRSRYADLYDFAPVGYCTLDLEGRITEINVSGATMLGSPRDSLRNRSFASVALLRDRNRFNQHLKACREENRRVTTELALSAGRRGTRVIEMVSEPIRDGSGTPTACRTILTDISDRKRGETKLQILSDAGQLFASSLDVDRTLQAVARLIVPALADICIIDLLEGANVERRVVQFADDGKQAVLAGKMKDFAPRADWRTPSARAIFASDTTLLPEITETTRDRLAHDDVHAAVLRAAGLRSMVAVPLVANGRTLGALTWIAAESERRYGAFDLRLAQDLAGRAAMALDNARLHADARRAVAARDAILAVVSHDLTNPLSVIVMTTGRILSDTIKSRRRGSNGHAMEMIQRAAEQMRRLIRDLLDVSSIEAQRLTIERSRQSVALLLADAVEGMQARADMKSLRLDADLDAAPGLEVDCDRDRIQQVLANLIGNAVKFTEKGSVSVGARRREQEVWFSVTDTGSGIPAADLDHVFDRFWQARKTARAGTGLGLSIAKGIVEAHGGKIWAESEVGVGTTLRFTLPSAGPASRQPAEPVVLIADDDPTYREALADTVRAAGYAVVAVSDGAAALAYLRRAPAPHSVLLDLTMPVMDGWDFLEERNRDAALRPIPVIVLSALRGVEGQVTAAHASFVSKWSSADQVIDRLSHLPH
jgi:PAS domain S-box-containing protein